MARTAADVAKDLDVEMNETLKSMNRQAQSRARRAANIMRITALHVLRGEGHGRVYKKPGTYGKADKVTKRLMKDYGHKLRDGQLYRASAPGEVPAKRFGLLRESWRKYALATPITDGMRITARIQSGMEYAPILNEGTKDGRIAPRPFADKIINEALPKVRQIYKERFLN